MEQRVDVISLYKSKKHIPQNVYFISSFCSDWILGFYSLYTWPFIKSLVSIMIKYSIYFSPYLEWTVWGMEVYHAALCLCCQMTGVTPFSEDPFLQKIHLVLNLHCYKDNSKMNIPLWNHWKIKIHAESFMIVDIYKNLVHHPEALLKQEAVICQARSSWLGISFIHLYNWNI